MRRRSDEPTATVSLDREGGSGERVRDWVRVKVGVRPFVFTGKIDKLTIALDEPVLTPEDRKKLEEAFRAVQEAK